MIRVLSGPILIGLVAWGCGPDAPNVSMNGGADAAVPSHDDGGGDDAPTIVKDASVDATMDAATKTATVLQIAAGYSHSCAVLSNGVVKCWGGNNAKQIGDGTDLIRGRATSVAGLGSAVQVSVGDSQSCAVLSNDEVWCWGLVDSTTSPGVYSAPRRVAGLAAASMVSVRGSTTCALLRDGSVACWSSSAPMPVPIAGLVGATAISGRCAIVAGGTVKCGVVNYEDGSVTLKTIGGLVGATSIATNEYDRTEGCAVTPQGVYCWERINAPIATLWTGTLGALDVALGQSSSSPYSSFDNRAACITMVGGEVQCGIPGATMTPVQGLPPSRATARGSNFSCALALDGTRVHCWGLNNNGQLGDGSYQPTPLVATGLGNVTSLAVGNHSCLVSNGGAQCWGADGNGQLGRGTVTGYGSLGPVPTLTTGVTKVVIGEAHSCALLAGGDVYCWGSNDTGGNGRGQLGNGTYVSSAVPVLSFTGAVDIAATSATSCALRANGDVWCWGSDRYSQLTQLVPLPDGDWSNTPVRTQITGAQQIAGGGQGTMCALSTSGAVGCWGQMGGYFQVGGSGPPSANVVSIAAGENHACARMTNGSVNCWGENSYGSSPGIAAGVAAATQVAAGAGGLGGHSCALLAGGDARCWGGNFFGQLGDGSTVNRSDTRTVLGINNATIIAAGSNRTCAALRNGELRCWGGPFVTFSGAPVRVLDLP
jgi:alpha-tubulin suppressor-like RCC1 family protein